MAIRKELLDELIKDCKSPEDLLGKHGLISDVTDAVRDQVKA